MTLVLTIPCQRCQGAGKVGSPEWKAWFADHPTWKEQSAPEARGTQPDAPEEIMCAECEGGCVVLTEDGQAVATLVRSILAENKAQEAREAARKARRLAEENQRRW